MEKVMSKNDLAAAVEVADIVHKLGTKDKEAILNIIRGFGLAKGVDVLPPLEPEPPQHDKSA